MAPIALGLLVASMGIAAGFLLGRFLPRWVSFTVWAAIAVIGVGLFVATQNLQGYDAIGAVAMLVLVDVPVLIGAVIGGGAGMALRKRRA